MFHKLCKSDKLSDLYKTHAFIRDYGNWIQVDTLIQILEANISFSLTVQNMFQPIASESSLPQQPATSFYMFDQLKQKLPTVQ